MRVLLIILLLCSLAARPVRADDAPAGFSGPDAAALRADLTDWLSRAVPDETTRQRILDSWPVDAQLAPLAAEDRLDLLIATFAQADTATRQLLESSSTSGPLSEVLYDGLRNEAFYRHHVQLFHARWLAQHRLFDEALPLLEQLPAEEVLDPASLFFYRAVCQSQLLHTEAASDSLNLLLNHTADVPARFQSIARLLLQELSQQTDDDLNHVSRLMADVQRHLDLGRSGDRVQTREQQVVEALDQLLEQLEQQQNQGNGGGQGGGEQQGSSQPGGQPLSESRVGGIKGKGEADRKKLTETGSWGMQKTGEEAKARQLIRQQFPASYLDIISEYSRRIAERQ